VIQTNRAKEKWIPNDTSIFVFNILTSQDFVLNMSGEASSMFPRVRCTFEKEVTVAWEKGRQTIHRDSSGTWYIEFTKTSIEGPTILSLSVYHQSTSSTEYEMVELRGPCLPFEVYDIRDERLNVATQFVSLSQPESNKEPLNIATFGNLRANEISRNNYESSYQSNIYFTLHVAYNCFIPENDQQIPKEFTKFPTPRLSTDLEGLLSNGQSADVWFNVGSEEISAHKLILCARVPYFKKMFESGMKEAVDNKVEVPDTDPEIFKRLLKFIYTGRVDEDLNDYAADLLGLADIYDIHDLKGFCEASLLNLVGSDNLISTLITAHIYECPDLKQKCIDELIQKRKDLKKEQLDQMKAALKPFPELCVEVLMGVMQI